MWTKLDTKNDTLLEEAEEEQLQNSEYFTKNEYDKAFSLYDKVTVKIRSKLEKYKKPVVSELPPVQLPENIVLNAVPNKSNIKLKSIDIPTFSGDYKKWISFKNMFDSLVHNSTDFTNLQKIHYLKSCLSGEAETIISQFDITEDSYDPAYLAITERFHNEVILVDTHIISLLSQPNLTFESSNGIKELMDVTTENIRALNSLKVYTGSWDPILLLLLVQKLDAETRRLWEQYLKPKVRPTLKAFLDFLGTRFHALWCQQNFKFSIESSSQIQQQSNKKSFSSEHCQYNSSNYKPQFQDKIFPPRVHQSFHNSSHRSCPICSKENHSVFSCERFRKANQRTRVEMVNCARLCKRCLRNHSSVCTQNEGCRACGGNHHTFLHLDRQERDTLSAPVHQGTQETNQSEGNNETPTLLNSHHICLQRSAPYSVSKPVAVINSHHINTSVRGIPVEINQVDRYVTTWDAPVLLATATILIRSAKHNTFHPCRCLLDQASEASYISESAAKILGVNKTAISASMSGLGGIKTVSANSSVEFEIGSKVNHEFILKVQAIVVPKVTNLLPSMFIPRTDWKHIEGLQLADPEFYKPAEIDIILGAPIYGYLILPGLIKATPDCPVAQNTEFGWILSGATEPMPKPANESILTKLS